MTARRTPYGLTQRLAGLAVLVSASLGLAALSPAQSQALSQAQPTSVPLDVSAVDLYPERPQDQVAGMLQYAGGVVLSSRVSDFGGISGLHVSADGRRAVMVTDAGQWLDADLDIRDGRLRGLSGLRMGPLLDAKGAPSKGKRRGDAEGLTWSDGAFFVSFERDHRIWRYAGAEGSGVAPFDALPQPVALPDDFAPVPANQGLEALTARQGGFLLLTEGARNSDGSLRGWLGRPGAYTPLSVQPAKPFSPTDAAMLPGGDVLILERHYSPLTGVAIMVRRLAAETLADGTMSVLAPELVASLGTDASIDNMEGLAAIALPGAASPPATKGDTQDRAQADNPAAETPALIFMISDDNFNVRQRTVLLAFRLDP